MNENKEFQIPLFEEKSNYAEVADYYRDLESSYDKIMFSALLVGSGAAVTIFANALFVSSLNSGVSNFIIPALWFFVFSLVSVFFSGFFYTLKTSHFQDYQRTAGRSQSFEFARVEFLKQKFNDTISEIEKANLEVIVRKRNDSKIESKEAETRAVKCGKVSRALIMIGIVLFGAGLLLPLVFVSINSKFVGFT